LQAGWSEIAQIRALQTTLMHCPYGPAAALCWAVVSHDASRGQPHRFQHLPPLQP
jgi:hypothetical protein